MHYSYNRQCFDANNDYLFFIAYGFAVCTYINVFDIPKQIIMN